MAPLHLHRGPATPDARTRPFRWFPSSFTRRRCPWSVANYCPECALIGAAQCELAPPVSCQVRCAASAAGRLEGNRFTPSRIDREGCRNANSRRRVLPSGVRFSSPERMFRPETTLEVSARGPKARNLGESSFARMVIYRRGNPIGRPLGRHSDDWLCAVDDYQSARTKRGTAFALR